MSKAEWFPRQLTVSMPGVGLTALTAALSSLPGRMIKRKKKTRAWTLAPEDRAPSWNCHLLAVT